MNLPYIEYEVIQGIMCRYEVIENRLNINHIEYKKIIIYVRSSRLPWANDKFTENTIQEALLYGLISSKNERVRGEFEGGGRRGNMELQSRSYEVSCEEYYNNNKCRLY